MMRNHGFHVHFASKQDRSRIYQLRHEIYARELEQHPINKDGRLCNRLDDFNAYLVVSHAN